MLLSPQPEKTRNNSNKTPCQLTGSQPNVEQIKHQCRQSLSEPGTRSQTQGGGLSQSDPAQGRSESSFIRMPARALLLAFLSHTTLDWIDASYHTVRDALPSRRTFFEHLQALIQYLPFDDWNHLMQFMNQRLNPDPLDSAHYTPTSFNMISN